MSDIQSNRAAWLMEARAPSLTVGPGPDNSKPQGNEVVIKVAAAGICPVDYKIQKWAIMPFEYPLVMGEDVSGIIVAVGPEVTRFAVGDRVMAQGFSVTPGPRSNRNGGFQEYVAINEPVVSKIPEAVSLESAAVLPSAISTATCGLYEHLKLEPPSTNPQSQDKILLVWGGASGVGASAIQLATAAGYDVVTTASSKNTAKVESLAATKTTKVAVFDYSETDVADRIIAYIKASGKTFVGGFDAIAVESSARLSARIVHAFGGGILPACLPGPEGLPEDVDYVFMQTATAPAFDSSHPGVAIWRDYVPLALENGNLKLFPGARIIEGGIAKIQEGIDVCFKGVSAEKVIVKF